MVSSLKNKIRKIIYGGLIANTLVNAGIGTFNFGRSDGEIKKAENFYKEGKLEETIQGYRKSIEYDKEGWKSLKKIIFIGYGI